MVNSSFVRINKQSPDTAGCAHVGNVLTSVLVTRRSGSGPACAVFSGKIPMRGIRIPRRAVEHRRYTPACGLDVSGRNGPGTDTLELECRHTQHAQGHNRSQHSERLKRRATGHQPPWSRHTEATASTMQTCSMTGETGLRQRSTTRIYAVPNSMHTNQETWPRGSMKLVKMHLRNMHKLQVTHGVLVFRSLGRTGGVRNMVTWVVPNEGVVVYVT